MQVSRLKLKLRIFLKKYYTSLILINKLFIIFYFYFIILLFLLFLTTQIKIHIGKFLEIKIKHLHDCRRIFLNIPDRTEAVKS